MADTASSRELSHSGSVRTRPLSHFWHSLSQLLQGEMAQRDKYANMYADGVLRHFVGIHCASCCNRGVVPTGLFASKWP